MTVPTIGQVELILGLRRQLAAKFPTGSLAVIETDVERWADLEPGCGRITAFTRAKGLGAE